MKTSRRDSYGFSSSPVWTWELGHKEAWAPKNCCFHTVVLEKTLDVLLDSMEIKPLSPKGNQLWIFVVRTNAEAEAPVLWSPDMKSWLIGKDSDAGKDWRWEKKGSTEDEMIGWHRRLNEHECKLWREWRTEKPGMLQSMGSQSVGHDWATENQLQNTK